MPDNRGNLGLDVLVPMGGGLACAARDYECVIGKTWLVAVPSSRVGAFFHAFHLGRADYSKRHGHAYATAEARRGLGRTSFSGRLTTARRTSEARGACAACPYSFRGADRNARFPVRCSGRSLTLPGPLRTGSPMDVDTALRARGSTRAVLRHPAERATVATVLKPARCAPSATSSQPWQVHVVTGAARDASCHAVCHAAIRHPEQHGGPGYCYPPVCREPCRVPRRSCGWGLYALLGRARSDRVATVAQEHAATNSSRRRSGCSASSMRTRVPAAGSAAASSSRRRRWPPSRTDSQPARRRPERRSTGSSAPNSACRTRRC